MVSHCEFNWRFPHEEGCGTPFHVLIWGFCIFFRERAIQVLFSFLNQLLDFLFGIVGILYNSWILIPYQAHDCSPILRGACLVIVSFDAKKLLSLIFQFIIFFCCCLCSWCYIQEIMAFAILM